MLASRPADQRPDAVFAANDILAMGVVTVLTERGLRLPEDVSVVGFDDTDFAQVARVSLTTVRQPAREIGDRAAKLLLEEISGTPHVHENTVFTPELVGGSRQHPLGHVPAMADLLAGAQAGWLT